MINVVTVSQTYVYCMCVVIGFRQYKMQFQSYFQRGYSDLNRHAHTLPSPGLNQIHRKGFVCFMFIMGIVIVLRVLVRLLVFICRCV